MPFWQLAEVQNNQARQMFQGTKALPDSNPFAILV